MRLADVGGQLGLVAEGGRQDDRVGDLEGQARLHVDGQDVLLEGDLVAAVHLPVVEHPVVAEELHRLLGDELGEGVERGLEVRQAPLGRLGLPLVGVAVLVEHHRAVVGDDVLEHVLHGGVELGPVGQLALELGGDVVEGLGQDGVDGDHGPGDGLQRAGGPELEPVAGEGERAGPVAVARVGGEDRAGCRRRSRCSPSPSSEVAPPWAICSKTSASWSPRKIEMMAGGASLAPSRWSLVAEATEARSRPPYLCTERMTAAQNTRNWALSCGVSPGRSRLPSVELPSEKLTCLPEPLMPSKGFSWNRHSMPCFWATFLSVVISSCWWSAATLERSNIGASSNWPGATSLWRGLGRDAELEELALAVHHVGQHPLGDGAEVVVVELLALGGLGAEQRAAGVEQVGPVTGRSCGRSGSTPARPRRTTPRHRDSRGRRGGGPARPAWPWPAASAAAGSCCRVPPRSWR